jgi:hypothetical protein
MCKCLDKKEIHTLEEGEYLKAHDGVWYCRPPGAPKRMIANLSGHLVIDHEDGTITVNPSILITCGDYSWHGYLIKGEWRTC